MKKILIAVTLLALSSTAFADVCNKGGSKATNGSLCPNALNAYTTTVDQKNIDAAQNAQINTATQTATNAANSVAGKADKTYVDSELSKKVDKTTYLVDQQTQSAKDAAQSTAIASKADKSALNDVSVKTDHAFNIAVEGRATANNALTTINNLTPQIHNNTKAIIDVDNKVDVNKAEQAVVDKNQNEHINAVQDAAQSANEKADAGAVRADNIEKSLANTDERSINNAVRLDGVESKNDDQDKVISGKADQSALDKEVSDRTKGDAALSDTINQNKNDQAVIDNGQNVRMDGIETQAGVLDTRVGKTEVRLDNAEGAIRETNEQLSVTDKRSQNNAVRLDGVETKNTEQDKLISQKVDTTTFKDDQERQDAVIATKASKKELASETASRKSADVQLSSRIDSNDATLVQHDERITSNTNRIGSVEKRVSNFENQTNRRFSDIDKRIGDNRKVASAGIAGAGAMANIPQVTQNGNVSVGAGIGGYDGEQAVAVGFSARVSESVTTKVSVSTNTQSEVLWGAGVGVEW